MAIDKIGSAAITDCTVVAADITPGTITNAKLAGSIANAKLANSSVTINGTAISLGASASIPAVSWQSVITSNTTMVAGRGYFVNTTSGAISMTLPSSASAGDTIAIKDYAGTFATNNLSILRNSHKIQGLANDSKIDTNRASVTLVYVDATKGWLYANESNVADLQNKEYVTATGGTITTSGDFKIHSFTGDGCFVVSDAGNSAGSNSVDYLVVAGGGGGGRDNFPNNRQGGGGGAGGFRMSNSLCLPAPTTSPLANPSGLPVSAQTYPVTVGGGGVGGDATTGATVCGGKGSNSIFSTITSAGGGGGQGHNSGYGICVPNPHSNSNNGGSGGGVGACFPNPQGRGTGNTPPVSPSQGNPAGPAGGAAPNYYASGGGGAGAAGGDASNPKGGDGGVGSFVSPSFAVGCAGTPGPVGSTRYFAGGGASHSCSTGGSGGGGPSPAPNVGTAGTANTGGGGGGSRGANGGAGGKGIVLIRYKFQN